MGKTEIRVLQERKAELIILANRHQRACGIETLVARLYDHQKNRDFSTYICEQEECKEVDKGIREFLVCFERRPNLVNASNNQSNDNYGCYSTFLFPADRHVMFTLGERWTRSRLLINNYDPMLVEATVYNTACTYTTIYQ